MLSSQSSSQNDSLTTDRPVLLITGLSGAGMSSALKHLEDLGYEVFDNFPVTMVRPLLDDPAGEKRPVAIGIDSRTRGFEVEAIERTVADTGARLVFITCEEDELLRRFTETRRRHPLAGDRPAQAGIKREQTLLYDLRALADLVIDTTALSVHDLRRMLEGHFRTQAGAALTVSLMSFGFRYGLPREADLVFDVRFLKNPHWVPALKPLTGRDEAVGVYVAQDPDFAAFFDHLTQLLTPLLPRYRQEGKSYLTIAIGCTGGRHRSVYTAEKLQDWLAGQDVSLHVRHRDIEH